jgi:hypothetical protein
MRDTDRFKPSASNMCRRLQTIRGLICLTVGSENLEFSLMQHRGRELLKVEHRAHPRWVLSVEEDSSWTQTRRLLASKMMEKPLEECGICMDDMRARVSCGRCGQPTCKDCYIANFEAGRGVVVCPFCRYEVGVAKSTADLEFALCMLRGVSMEP